MGFRASCKPTCMECCLAGKAGLAYHKRPISNLALSWGFKGACPLGGSRGLPWHAVPDRQGVRFLQSRPLMGWPRLWVQGLPWSPLAAKGSAQLGHGEAVLCLLEGSGEVSPPHCTKFSLLRDGWAFPGSTKKDGMRHVLALMPPP